MKPILVFSNFISPTSVDKCKIIKNGAMIITQQNGKNLISYIGKKLKKHNYLNEFSIVHHFEEKIIIPSFFDMHFHWVQDDVREMPKANLLEWLEKYTFPNENKFKNKTFAKKKAKQFFNKLVSTGTLGGAVYSSIHEHALEYAFDHALGDFIIGNVQMTMNSPKFLTQTKSKCLTITKRMSEKYKEKYALTPRFAITTDPETMKKSSAIAKKNKSFMQTHLSETKNEIDFVLSLYKKIWPNKKFNSYTDIYNNVDLLTSKTIMGHGIYLSNKELDIIKKHNTTIAHCPTSNAPHRQKGLGSGLFDYKKVEKKGIRWALGSDIGGGPFLSMFDVMRSFVDQNNKIGIKTTYSKALSRATLAGAEILKLEKKNGSLDVNKEANFLVLGKIKDIKSKNTEEILTDIIKKGRRDRSKYDSLPEKVFYKGISVYSKGIK